MRQYVRILGGLALLLVLRSSVGWANEWSEYGAHFGHNIIRGARNIIGAPLEIPRAVEFYDKTEEAPTMRALRGFSEGTFNSIRRCGAGLWDWLVAPIPGGQEGILLDPETLI